MTDLIRPAIDWGLHAAAAGAVVFALGWAWLSRVSNPARRERLAGWVVRGGVLAAVLCLCPAWLVLPDPWGKEPQPVTVVPISDRPLRAERLPRPPAPRVHWVWTSSPTQAQAAEPGQSAPPATVDDAPAAHARSGGGQRVIGRGFWEVPLRPTDPTDERERGPEAAATPQQPVPGDESAARRAERSRASEARAALVLPGSAPPNEPPDARPEIAGLLLLAYGVGVVAAGLPLVLGAVGLARLRRPGTPAPPAVQAVFDELTAGMRRRPRLLLSGRLASPVCFGLFRPVVMLPKSLAAAGERELRWVFAHELDHLRRGDQWVAWWLGLAKAMYFFVPWFWRVRRDLGLTQEFLADAAAVAAGGRAADYAAFLVRLSTGPGRRHPVGAAAVRAGKSDLFWRVTMLLASKDRAAPRATRAWAAAVAAVVIGIACVVSGVGFARPDDDTKPADTKKADKAKDPAKADDKKPEFDPKDVRVGPPPELAALREAVERAGKKGENVDEIRKQLDALEKALAGKPWVKPRPAEPAAPPAPPAVPAFPPPAGGGFPGIVQIAPPAVPFEGFRAFQPDREALQKAQELMRKAQEMLAKDPTDKEALKMLQEAKEAMAKAVRPAAGFDWAPGFPGGGFAGVARSGEVRLGVRVEKVPAALADQLDLPKGQGVVVADVVKGTAAEKAGLKANDVIVEFAGKPVTDNPTEFVQRVQGLKKDEKVDITYIRKGKKGTAKGVEVPEAKVINFPGVNDFDIPALPVPPALPAPPAPPALPVPPAVGVAPALPAPPAPPALPLPPDGVKQSSVSVQVQDGKFTIDATQDGVKIMIEGTVEVDGTAAPEKIEIKDGDKKVEAKTVEKVPAQYRDRVKKLLDGVKRR